MNFTLAANLAAAAHTINVREIDNAGNTSTNLSKAFTYVIDFTNMHIVGAIKQSASSQEYGAHLFGA